MGDTSNGIYRASMSSLHNTSEHALTYDQLAEAEPRLPDLMYRIGTAPIQTNDVMGYSRLYFEFEVELGRIVGSWLRNRDAYRVAHNEFRKTFTGRALELSR